MDWDDHLSACARGMKPSTIREILKLTQDKSVISFAGGLPAPSLFPVEALREACDKVLVERGTQALQYSPTEGFDPLRDWVASRVGATRDRVQIVSGSQQGLDLVAKLLCNPGDRVAVGAPTYMGALRAFDAYGVDYVPVACDDDGMIPDALEEALAARPKLLYVIPSFDNPTGATLTLERRRRLLELTERYDVPVLEDDPYGELRFEGEAPPTLFSLAPERVIYAGTFSKIVVPGFRLAWLVADPALIARATLAKQAADLHTATFTQMVGFELLSSGFLDGQLPRVRDHYRRQRDRMLAALDASFPDGVAWTRPAGGMFLWVTLPEGLDSTELLREAVREKVAFVPGAPFFAAGGGANTLRLSYSVASAEQIREGMGSLGRVLKARLGSPVGA